jgi:hypothetical protein
MDPRHIELLNSVIRTPGRRINKERKRERERERERDFVYCARRISNRTLFAPGAFNASRARASITVPPCRPHLRRRCIHPMTLLSKSVLPLGSTFARFSRINVATARPRESGRELSGPPLSDNNRHCTCIRWGGRERGRERKREYVFHTYIYIYRCI